MIATATPGSSIIMIVRQQFVELATCSLGDDCEKYYVASYCRVMTAEKLTRHSRRVRRRQRSTYLCRLQSAGGG